MKQRSIIGGSTPEMSAYAWPGISYLDEQIIIDLITQEFKLPDQTWVKTRSRLIEFKVARQLLMTCLIDHLGYTLRQAGEVCMRDHCTARWSKTMIHDTLWNDLQFGRRVKNVYRFCENIRNNCIN